MRRAAAAAVADPLIRAAYRGLLRRAPDEAGLRQWRRRLRAGLPWSAFLAELAESEEFASRVDRVIPLLSRLDGEIVLGSQLPDGSPIRMGGPCGEQSFVAPLVAARGAWEPALTRLLFALLRPGDTFLDGGANLGWFSVAAARATAPGGRVVAFEPGAETRELLRANLARNAVEAEVRPEALWNATERRSFSLVSEGLAYAHLAAASTAADAVPCAALDDLVASGLELGRLTVVKLDIEGAEPQALAGMRATVERHRPTLLVEVNSHCLERLGNTAGDVWDALAALGCAVEVLPEPHQEDAFAGLPVRAAAAGVPPLRRLTDRGDFLARVRRADDAVEAPSDVVQVVASPPPG